MNQVVLIGRVAREIDLKFLPSGMAVAKFSLAVDKELFGEKKQEAINQGKPTADFINITVFGKSAENAANYLAKGNMCAINGRINTGSYTKDDGTKIYTTDVLANRVEFIGSKNNSNNNNSAQKGVDDIFQPAEDIFQPIGDEDDIPF